MFLGETKVGKPIEILIERDGYNYRVVSKIEEASEGRICISLIASSKRVFQFLDTDVIDLVYRKEDRMWKWSNVKGDVIELDGEQFHCLMSLERGESYNRRNAYRVTVNKPIDLQYKIMEEGSPLEIKDCFRLKSCIAMLRDISEVGVGFYSDELIDLESEVFFQFSTEYGDVKCEAIVVRFFEARHGNFRYYYGCRFKETSKTLTKYIYEMQRRELKKARDRIDR